MKVFDNLYYLGLNTGQSAWAVVDPAGIILIDAGWDYTAQAAILDGLRAFKLDPNQIKYILISHGHADHFGGVRYLQDRVTPRPRVAVSAADWELIAENDEIPAANKPVKDMVATDGQTVTVGNTTVVMYVTPGHTPGTMSFVFPVKDGNRTHTAGMAGGAILGRAPAPQLTTFLASAKRFRDLETQAGVDVLLSTIDRHDNSSGKLAALRTRKAGEPHPFVGADLVKRYWDVLINCEEAQLVWAAAPTK
jgi:metallo-beta-lactamase class B